MLQFNEKLKTAPASQVVSVADLKTFLKIDNTDDDAFLAMVIDAATMRCEEYLSLKFINQTWLLYLDAYPLAYNKGPWWDGVREGAIGQLTKCAPEMVLPFGRLVSVTAIKSYNADGTEEVFAAPSYQLDTIGYRGRILLNNNYTWPAQSLRAGMGVEIEAVFGFGPNATDVPAPIVHAVKLLCAKLFENRGDVTQSEFFGAQGFTMPSTSQMLLEPYRQVKVG